MFDFFYQKKKEGGGKEEAEKKKKEKPKKISSLAEEKGTEVPAGIKIYTMPKNYLAKSGGEKEKKVGLAIIAGGGIFFLAAAAGLVYYFLKQKPAAEPAPVSAPPAEEVATTTVSEEPQPAKSEAKEVYQEIVKKAGSFFTYEQFREALDSYFSQRRLEKAEEESGRISQLSKEDKSLLTDLIINFFPKEEDIQAIEEEEAENGATRLKVTTSRQEALEVEMLNENESWKLDSAPLFLDERNNLITIDDWLATVETGTSASATSTPSELPADEDGDGLSDKEEAALGSDPAVADSDGDGYDDYTETVNLYNPAGSGRLENNSNIKKYENFSYNYSLLYPLSWAQSRVGDDDSIILRSGDNHFIQIIAQTNSSGQSIAEWYRQAAGEEAPSETISFSNWTGIQNTEGNTVYFTDKNKKYIFTVAYNVGPNGTSRDYLNIFKMILRTLTLNEE